MCILKKKKIKETRSTSLFVVLTCLIIYAKAIHLMKINERGRDVLTTNLAVILYSLHYRDIKRIEEPSSWLSADNTYLTTLRLDPFAMPVYF